MPAPDTFNNPFIVLLFDIVVNPDTFDDVNYVDTPETNNLLKLFLFNNVVEVHLSLIFIVYHY